MVEFDADHQAMATNVLDEFVFSLQVAETGAEVLAHAVDLRQQLIENIEEFQRHRRGKNVPAERGAVHTRLDYVARPLVRHHDGRECSLKPRHDRADRFFDRWAWIIGDQSGDDLRVGGGAELDALRAQLGMKFNGVSEVAVVCQRQLTAAAGGTTGAVNRLRVFPAAGAGR